ncbi:MAG: CBS domain-containing protein [Bacteroidota bacterium]
MGKVINILEGKGAKKTNVFSVTPTTIVYNAIEIMAEKNIGALLITENDRLIGIFSERDYARKIILKGRSSKETTIGELMTKDPVTVTPESSIEDCMELMTTRRFRHLPVMEGSTVVGVISITDVVRSIIEEQKSTISHLQSYIAGQ